MAAITCRHSDFNAIIKNNYNVHEQLVNRIRIIPADISCLEINEKEIRRLLFCSSLAVVIRWIVGITSKDRKILFICALWILANVKKKIALISFN
ncbi:hypothetical protein BDE36_1995 [Arcticibacter tournemirensis]|nr:hypothetical protein BDE36_1995 [Arcticibacter tournemirensis]